LFPHFSHCQFPKRRRRRSSRPMRHERNASGKPMRRQRLSI